MKLTGPEYRRITLESQPEVRFTPTGMMAVRVYAAKEDTRYYLFSENFMLVEQLTALPSGTTIRVYGNADTVTYERVGEIEPVTVEEFYITNYWEIPE